MTGDVSGPARRRHSVGLRVRVEGQGGRTVENRGRELARSGQAPRAHLSHDAAVRARVYDK